MNFKDEVKLVINAISESITKENLSENHEIVVAMQELRKQDERRFLQALESGIWKFECLIAEMLDIPEQPNRSIAKYIANGEFEHFHKERIRKIEGMSCCADKSRFIKSMTLKALRTKQNLSLFADYQNVEQIKEDKEQQAYWSPTSIKDTDEAIKMFWDWYLLRTY